MPRNEAQTRFELIDPTILRNSWTSEHIKNRTSENTVC
jgi:hypothetical protein